LPKSSLTSTKVDIDDTIKISEVLRQRRLLYNTFAIEHPKHVPGMPEFYQNLQQKFNDPTFFYLSASPWQLYVFIRQFLTDNGFPHGQVILREMTLLQFSSIFNSFELKPKDYKVTRMEKIHSWFPSREFICIGDSTQSDPEAYAQMYIFLSEINLTFRYRTYPGWIKKIWIHVVSGVDLSEEKTKNDPKRFTTAFQGIPQDVWTTFVDPAELADHFPEVSNDTISSDA